MLETLVVLPTVAETTYHLRGTEGKWDSMDLEFEAQKC